MRFGSARSTRSRLARLAAAVVAVTVVPVAGTYLASAAGLVEWPPRPSGALGFACGLALGAVVLFEMLLAPRKWLRGRRLGATRVWLRLHVWVGLASLPLALIHAGFGFGGPLPAVTLALFLAVFVSGVWGLALQQWLPERLLAEFPQETIAAQVPRMAAAAATEAEQLVAALPAAGPGVAAFRDRELVPYLRAGRGSRSGLARRGEADRRFRELTLAAASEAAPVWGRLRELVDARRQWDAAVTHHFWLHNWLLVHLPLSVAMTGFMLVHAARALKYW